jgi:5-methylcytosine-specific restriction endonuclease McrBC regulatory subunit McrC
MPKYVISDFTKIDELVSFETEEKATLEEIERVKKVCEKIEDKMQKGDIATVGEHKFNEDERKFYNPHMQGGFMQGCVGVIKSDDVELIIKTRFDDFDKKNEKSKPYFLFLMLEEFLQTYSQNFENTFDYNEHLQFLLMVLFKQKLQGAASKTIFRQYVKRGYNDYNIKGAIDFKRHIRENITQRNGKVAYNTTEWTVDNPISHLILHTYERIKNARNELWQKLFSTDIETKKLIDFYKTEIGTLKNLQHTMKLCEKPIRNSLYADYEEIRKLCFKILQNIGVDVFASKNDDTQAILFYVPDLWEKFLEHYFFNGKGKTQDSFTKCGFPMRPDFVLNDAVYDAKFKDEIKRTDFYQIVTYMTAKGFHKCGAIYPMKESDEQKTVPEDEDINDKHDKFKRIKIPVLNINDMNYKKWRTEFIKIVDSVAKTIL